MEFGVKVRKHLRQFITVNIYLNCFCDFLHIFDKLLNSVLGLDGSPPSVDFRLVPDLGALRDQTVGRTERRKLLLCRRR